MSAVEALLKCSGGCLFGKDCAQRYKLGTCRQTIDEIIDDVVAEPLEEKVVRGNKISAAMTDHDGTVSISEGVLTVDIKTKRRS